MAYQKVNQIIIKVFGQTSIRSILIIPFVVQVVGAAGLVGYLSFRTGQEAIADLANQLIEEVGDRIYQNLELYLEIPAKINQKKLDAIELGFLEIDNLEPWEKYLWRQVQSYPYINFTALANRQGEYRAGERLSDGSLMINIIGPNTDFSFYSYHTNEEGDRTTVEAIVENADPRNHTIYITAKEAGKARWSDVYISYLEPTLLVSHLYPVYDDSNNFQAVLISTLRLDHISEFLHSLSVGKSGQAFIIERDGTLLATSTLELPFTIDEDDRRELLNAHQSNNPITQAATKYLFNTFGDIKTLATSQKHELKFNQNLYFIKVIPLRDEYDLDWLIVVVVPESDFMSEINANIRTTIKLVLGAMIVAIIVGVLTARWITSPILRLNIVASNLAKGDWKLSLDLQRNDEIGELTEAFHTMATQLQQSFQDLTILNEALVENESKLTKFLNVIPVGVAIYEPNGELIYFNQTAEDLLSLENRGDLETYSLQLNNHIYQGETNQLYTVSNLPSTRALEGETVMCDDLEIQVGDRRIPLEVRGTPIVDDQGNIIYAIVAFQDITEYKQAAKILSDYSKALELEVNQRRAELAQAHAEILALNQCLQAENSRLETELEVAQKLQEMILPKWEELQNIPNFEVAGFMQPADEVGGDYYDIILESNGRLTVGIGDVTGHGLESGVLMLMTQTAARTLSALPEGDPVNFLNAINRVIYSNAMRMKTDKNLTLSFLTVQDNQFHLAGQHETLLVVRRDGEVEQIDTMDLGFPIGLEEDISDFINQVEVKVNLGEIIVLYTDGIPEAINEQQEMYGMERLCGVLQENREESVDSICEMVVKDVKEFIGTQKLLDDITLVILKKIG
ncbi:MAG: HAMP domain-containing protein [Arthrospira sp. PLM2.Bin9]|nr:SpoIIE family protein phosphatase [Arthrospira sp. PLM2.Bin9]TVU53693.1 MAG: HAMP domain-containing protein [Arthrospira sp. PLM2.Bin9]